MSEVTKHPKEPKTVARCWLWRRLCFVSPVWFVAEQDVSARPLSDELYGLWVMQSMAARSHSQNLCWHKSAASSRQKEPCWYTVLVPQSLFTLSGSTVSKTCFLLAGKVLRWFPVWKQTSTFPKINCKSHHSWCLQLLHSWSCTGQAAAPACRGQRSGNTAGEPRSTCRRKPGKRRNDE